jgi:hypothetical protein
MNIIDESLRLLKKQHFDTMAVAVVDFNNRNFKSFEITNHSLISERPYLYFDLASITKTLTNSVIFLKHTELFDQNMQLLLNHRAGLPMGGRLSKDNWREFLLQYKINESETLYSDYSSLRCMLEIEKKSGKKIEDLCNFYFNPELVYWLNKKEDAISPITGWRNHRLISGDVHDDNCFYIHEFISHAGLFATIDGFSKALLELDSKINLLDKMNQEFNKKNDDHRFICGFDRPTDLKNTLAGSGCSAKTFGHTGFTGTSYWIDIEKKRASIILTNATKNYWYERSGLTEIRKRIGELIWALN